MPGELRWGADRGKCWFQRSRGDPLNQLLVGAALQTPPDMPVRLAGGPTKLEGRLEVRAGQLVVLFCGAAVQGPVCNPLNPNDAGRHSYMLQVFMGGQWGTVCPGASGFPTFAARMVCTQLGYGGSAVVSANYQPASSLPILLASVRCGGKETALSACKFTTVTAGCTHAQDVGIRCSSELMQRPACWMGLFYSCGCVNRWSRAGQLLAANTPVPSASNALSIQAVQAYPSIDLTWYPSKRGVAFWTLASTSRSMAGPMTPSSVVMVSSVTAEGQFSAA